MSVRALHGDCREVLPTLSADSFDCVVTSPPYWGLRSYLPDGHDDKHREIGLEPTMQAYLDTIVGVMREVRRVLKPSGVCFLNVGDCYSGSWGNQGRKDERGTQRPINGEMLQQVHDGRYAQQTGTGSSSRTGLKPKDLCLIPNRLAIALQDDGWFVRSEIIWAKPNPMPESVTDRPTSAHEKVWLLTKSASYFYDAEAIAEPSNQPDRMRQDKVGGASHAERGQHSEGGLFVGSPTRNARNVWFGENLWTITIQPYKGAHFAAMPPALAERCIKAGSSECGCCPACGKPWERIRGGAIATGGRGAGNGFARPERVSVGGRGDETVWVPKSRETIGWRPTCSCTKIRIEKPIGPEKGTPYDPIPARILDPFGGAGTTGLVADRLGRDATLIELNPAYLKMGADRISNDAPLFAEVMA